MTDKKTIVETLARNKRVEQLALAIAHQDHMSADLKDLCQMVYLVLLEYDESRLQDLWEHNEMDFFIARVIMNQYRSTNSPYFYQIRKLKTRSVFMGVGGDINDAAIERIRSYFIPKEDYWKK